MKNKTALLTLPQTNLQIAGIGLLVVATTLAAWVRLPLPFTPVPVTMQTFVVLLGAAWLGARPALIAQGIYLALGLMAGLSGINLFATNTPVAIYLLGPTGGYLVGFLAASLWLGATLHNSRTQNHWRILGSFVFADLLILICGVSQLKFFLNSSWTAALAMGFAPFVTGEAVKVVAASALYRRLKR